MKRVEGQEVREKFLVEWLLMILKVVVESIEDVQTGRVEAK